MKYEHSYQIYNTQSKKCIPGRTNTSKDTYPMHKKGGTLMARSLLNLLKNTQCGPSLVGQPMRTIPGGTAHEDHP